MTQDVQSLTEGEAHQREFLCIWFLRTQVNGPSAASDEALHILTVGLNAFRAALQCLT